VFINAGGGAALSVLFCIVAAGWRAMNWVEDGILRSGDEVRLHGKLPAR